MKPMIYVAGPITIPNPMHNTHVALDVGARLLDTGLVVPFVPHLTILWDVVIPRDYEEWMQYDFDVLEHCQAIYRIPGESAGADREMDYARQLGLMMFQTYIPHEDAHRVTIERVARWAETFRA